MRLIENFNLDNLCRKSVCYVVLNTFSISKNTAAVDVIIDI
jgi:hypothetical protein